MTERLRNPVPDGPQVRLRKEPSARVAKVPPLVEMAVAGLITSFTVGGYDIQSSGVDQIVRDVLAPVAAIYVPRVGARLYVEIGRVDRAVTTPDPTHLMRKSQQTGSAPDGLGA